MNRIISWSGLIALLCLPSCGVVNRQPCDACELLTDWSVSSAPAKIAPRLDAPDILAQTAIGGAGDDYAFDIWPAGDGFVITGRTRESDEDDFDVFIVKVDDAGEIVWAKRWGGDALDIGFAVKTLSDGTILVAGWTMSIGAGEGDYLLLGLNADGEAKFVKTYGGAGDDRAVQMTVSRDGGIVMVGETYSFGEGDSRFYLVKTDAAGNLLWERTYDDGPLNERGIAIVEHQDGFLLAGNSMDATSGSRASISNGLVIMTDAAGDERWRRRFGGDAHDIIHHAARLGDENFVLTGYTKSYSGNAFADIWTVAVSPEGESLSMQNFGGSHEDRNIIARTAPDGGIIIGGYTLSYGDGDWDALITRLDGSGGEEWSSVYGAEGDDGAVSLAGGPDNEIAVAGFTGSFGAGGQDILFMKLDAGNGR